MFSGKTEELIRRLKERNLPVNGLKYSNRPWTHAIQKKKSYHMTVIPLHPPHRFFCQYPTFLIRQRRSGNRRSSIFDEGLVDVCNQLADNGIRVIVAGLDMDFKRIPFGPIPALLAIADEVTKVHAICVKCGNLAYATHRITKSDKRVLLGEKADYEPLCRACYMESLKEETENK